MRKATSQLQRSQVSSVSSLSAEELLTNEISPLFDLKPISTNSIPRLVILEQKSLAQEKFSKDGVQKEMHIVVKNTPFQISVGLSSNVLGNKVLDFNLLTLEASLLFDCADEKAVPFLKQKPVEYKGHVNDRADTMKMDLKIKVLTSHCENMLFRIKFSCIDPRSGEDYPSLTAVSAPIKVISKPDQFRKRKQPEGEDAVGNPQVCCAEDADLKPPAKKPRTSRVTSAAANTQIIESLGRIEDEQREVRKLLELLTGGKEQNTSVMGEVPFYIPPMATTTTSTMITDCSNSSCNSNPMMTAANNAHLLSELQQQLQNFTPPSSLFLESVPSSEFNPCATTSKSTEEESLDLEAVYNRLIDTYLKLPLEQRAEKIRRVIRNSSTRRTETFCEMIALFNSEGLQKETGRECFLREGGPTSSTSSASPPTTCCGEGCPYRKELQRIDDLYSSFMADPCDSSRSGGE